MRFASFHAVSELRASNRLGDTARDQQSSTAALSRRTEIIPHDFVLAPARAKVELIIQAGLPDIFPGQTLVECIEQIILSGHELTKGQFQDRVQALCSVILTCH